MLRRILAIVVTLTVGILIADLAGAPIEPVGDAGAAALGPVVRAVAPNTDESDDLAADTLRLRERVRQLEDEARTRSESADLPALELGGDAQTTPARVVALDRAGAAGPERVTIDIGRREGVRANSAVIAPGGLVGRVIDVAEMTADVEVIGAPGAGVGVRTGQEGVIGTLTGSDPTIAHDADELVITQLGRDRASIGDPVRTLGSPGQRPYPPGIHVGRVTSVDRAPGRLTDTALVDPGVDLATLDIVAVVTEQSS